MELQDLKVDDSIGFQYKGGRMVKGKVMRIDDKGLLLKLYNDYIGKNESWYSGEEKYFNKGEMNIVQRIRPISPPATTKD